MDSEKKVSAGGGAPLPLPPLPLPPLSAHASPSMLPGFANTPIPAETPVSAPAPAGQPQGSPVKPATVGGAVVQEFAQAFTAASTMAGTEITEAVSPRTQEVNPVEQSPAQTVATAVSNVVGSPAVAPAPVPVPAPSPPAPASATTTNTGPFAAAGAAAAKAAQSETKEASAGGEAKATPTSPAGAPATPATASVEQPSLKPQPSLKESLKEMPKVAADAAKQAGMAYMEAGKEVKSTLGKLAKVPFGGKKGDPPITFTLDQIVTALFFLGVACQLALLPVFMPSVFRLAYCVVWGVLAGLGLSFLFYYNKKKKAERNELLATNLGLKGMYLVAGGLPSWFNISHKEKMEWMNALIEEIWPFVDKGICQMIKEITAQVMPDVLKSLPSALSGLVKSISFKHLTFGAAPFRVESIWVDPDEKDRLVMEVSVKWCGDPNITLAIEIPAGQKLCPRVMDITFVATIRIVLEPLVDRIPGFIGAMATVPKPPLIKYRLDFGKAMGGSMAPAAVTPVVNYFMKEVITKMLVWPQRLVVPILQQTEHDRVIIQRLMRRHRGVLRVCVHRAKELKQADWVGSNDVTIELTTDSEYFEATSIKRAKPANTGTTVPGASTEASKSSAVKHDRRHDIVVWEEYIYLLIQEPKDQMLRLMAYDIDRLRPGKLLTGQVSQVVNGRELIGRSLVKITEVCRAGTDGKNMEPPPILAHLGDADWGAPGGPGKGRGKVRMSMMYWPFEKFTKYDVENAMQGIVTVRLLKVWGLAAAGDDLSAFVRVTSTANKKEWKSSSRYWSRARHILRLQKEIETLKVAAQRDFREGRKTEAARKDKYVKALEQAVSKDLSQNNKARLVVDMDYTLDSGAMHAIYHVKLTDVIKVKVMEASLLSSAECLGRLDIPVSDIITAHDKNPLTGQEEYGLHRRKWEEYNPDKPDRPMESLERGLLLEEGDGARIWLELRWVPCIQAVGGAPPKADDDDAPPPASVF